ncbi:MAG: hypothetical protein AAB381_00360 [Patescibacteria group bacterium]
MSEKQNRKELSDQIERRFQFVLVAGFFMFDTWDTIQRFVLEFFSGLNLEQLSQVFIPTILLSYVIIQIVEDDISIKWLKIIKELLLGLSFVLVGVIGIPMMNKSATELSFINSFSFQVSALIFSILLVIIFLISVGSFAHSILSLKKE